MRVVGSWFRGRSGPGQALGLAGAPVVPSWHRRSVHHRPCVETLFGGGTVAASAHPSFEAMRTHDREANRSGSSSRSPASRPNSSSSLEACSASHGVRQRAEVVAEPALGRFERCDWKAVLGKDGFGGVDCGWDESPARQVAIPVFQH